MHHALGHQVVTHLCYMYGVYTYTLLLTLYGQKNALLHHAPGCYDA